MIDRAQSGVQVVGIDEAARYMRKLAAGVRAAAKSPVKVGSDVIYAMGIETGYRRDGRIARLAGGVFYLTRAFEAYRKDIPKRLAGAMDDGGPPEVIKELERIGHDMEKRAKDLVVRVTGTLQRSIRTIFPGGSAAVMASVAEGRMALVRPRGGSRLAAGRRR